MARTFVQYGIVRLHGARPSPGLKAVVWHRIVLGLEVACYCHAFLHIFVALHMYITKHSKTLHENACRAMRTVLPLASNIVASSMVSIKVVGCYQRLQHRLYTGP